MTARRDRDRLGRPLSGDARWLLSRTARGLARTAGRAVVVVAAAVLLVEMSGATVTGDTTTTWLFGGWLGVSALVWDAARARLGWFTAAAAVAVVWAAVAAVAAAAACTVCGPDSPRQLALASAAVPLAFALLAWPAPRVWTVVVAVASRLWRLVRR